MPSPATIADFLGLIRKCGLLDEQTLANVAFGLPREPAACAEALVGSGLLTPFQAKQLLGGQTRGLVLGPYRILAPLGQGGMGTVYLAEHAALGRKVAIKVLNEEQSREKLALERFFREARAAAALDHPNIVRLHDIAQYGGTHFLVMEFVDGTDLQALLEQTGPLHFAQAANYIAQAAAGLQHAHDRGFIHRDIKPANLILVRGGGLKILDMGLARSLVNAKDELTGKLDEEVITGTADFLSPEQALNVRLDTRTDIYSLGATFYTLLTSRPPYEGTTTQKLSQHQLAPPPDVRSVRADVPEGLAAVLTRMMAKRPDERYQAAREVIAALSPWTPGIDPGSSGTVAVRSDETALHPRAPAGGWGARFARGLRPNRLWVALGGAGAIVAAGILIALFVGAKPAGPLAGGDAPAPPPPPLPAPSNPRWLLGHEAGVNDLVVSPDDTRLASVDWDGKLHIWDARTGELLREVQTRPEACCLTCATTPDGQFILVAGQRMPVLAFEWATGREVRQYPPHDDVTWGLAVSPSGRHLLSCGNDGLVILRDLSTGAEIRRFACEAKLVWAAAFSADGTKVAAGTGGGPNPEGSHLVKVWSAAGGQLLYQLAGHTDSVRTLAFRPDGRVLASGGFDGDVRLWDLATGKVIRTLAAHDGLVERVCYLPGGRLLSCGGPMRNRPGNGEGGAAKLWDAEAGREVRTWRGREWAGLLCLAPYCGGRFGAAGGRDRNVRTWSLAEAPSERLLHAFKLSNGSPFRSRFQAGEHNDPTPFELSAGGVCLHCWKKESVAEFCGDSDAGWPWIGVTNLNDELSSQIIFQFEEGIAIPTVPGGRYRVRLEYRTLNEAEGRMSVRNPKDGEYPDIAEVRLARTDGKWTAAELAFRRPSGGKIDVCVTNLRAGEGNTLAVRLVEVFEADADR